MDGGGFDAVAYEEVLRDPEAFVDNNIWGPRPASRRGHLLDTHHITSDAILNTPTEKDGSTARRTRLLIRTCGLMVQADATGGQRGKVRPAGAFY